jgi:hypothetical protein
LQKEKKNLQELAGVYVYNVTEREPLDRPDARLIKEFSCIEGNAATRIAPFETAGQSSRDKHSMLLSYAGFVRNSCS